MKGVLISGVLAAFCIAGTATATAAVCPCVVKFARAYARHPAAQRNVAHVMRSRGVPKSGRTRVRGELLRAWRSRLTGACTSNVRVCRAVLACLAAGGSTVANGAISGTPWRTTFFQAEVNCGAAAAAAYFAP